MKTKNSLVLLGSLFLVSLLALSQTTCSAGPDEAQLAQEATSTVSEAVLVNRAKCASGIEVDFKNGIGAETLQQYALKCEDAIGVKMPGFDCDDPDATEPPNQGPAYQTPSCDAPNVLNQECDLGSRFHVLRRAEKNGDGIDIVAHCRKKGLTMGWYDDVAMIAYNRNNGAVCFFQALRNGAITALPHIVAAPADSQSDKIKGLNYFPWVTPAQARNGGCVNCHDSGAFIRSPYLSQLSGTAPATSGGTSDGVWLTTNQWSTPNKHYANHLQGTAVSEGAYSWNKTSPYKYVGLDFQSCESYSITSSDPTCTSCHRLGLGRCKTSGPTTPFAGGTALDYGMKATASLQASKTSPHSSASPIWMTPTAIGGGLYDPANEASAQSIQSCANYAANVITSGMGRVAPGCGWSRFAEGDSCMDITAHVIDGATKSTITSSTGGTTSIVSEVCASGANCVHGFPYWTSLHGPFFATSPASVRYGDSGYMGTFARIYEGIGAQWTVQTKLSIGILAHGQRSPGVPGGTWEAISYARISQIPRPGKCALSYGSISDDGSSAVTSWAFGPVTNLNILTGFIGNVSRSSASSLVTRDQVLQVGTFPFVNFVPSGNREFYQNHNVSAGTPAWFSGEVYSSTCPVANSGDVWSATSSYVALDVWSQGDVQLAPESNANKEICFISGIKGDWSQTWPDPGVPGGSIQTYAQIYRKVGAGWWLKVYPNNSEATALGATPVSASASCLSIDP